ncbi:MAG: hypothetical protein C3F07_10460 [Anaerolineales bacterium]|nr:MAG: hypothetical protein C3F07_10460 [Anaerolineales bacterium]
MSRIVFRGKTYNSVFEMPNDIREAYQIEKRKRPAETNAAKPLTDFVEMSDEIREIYERALGNVEEKSASSRPLSELPKTEDIYRQSAPAHMRDLPSDESVYRKSKPLAPPTHPAIEPENDLRRLALTLFVVIVLSAVALFVMQTLN